MKKKHKKTKKKRKIKKKILLKKTSKNRKKNKKKARIKLRKLKKIKENFKAKKIQKNSVVLRLVKFQLSLKPKFNFKVNFNLEKYFQSFFDKISETISHYKILKHDEKRRLRLEKIENERVAKLALAKQKKRKRN